MTSMTRRFSSTLLAAAMIAGLAAEPAFAQVTPGGALTGPAGGTGSTTAPSNSEGTPAGGSGALGTTRVGPSGTMPSTASPAPVRHRTRHARRRARQAARPAMNDTGSAAGLNGSNAPSR
jgi:hypothetical protein